MSYVSSTTRVPSHIAFKDETGKTYGRLYVEGVFPKIIRTPDGFAHGTYWVCRCSCEGKTGSPGWKRARGDALRRGNTKSCGCLTAEGNRERAKRMKLQCQKENSSVSSSPLLPSSSVSASR